MSLPAPPALNQDAQPSPYRTEMCGETDTASVLQALGRNVSPIDVINWLVSQGGSLANVAGGTDGPQLQDAMAHWGVQSSIIQGQPASTYTAHALAAGRYSIVAMWSDHNGDPSAGSGIGHWLLCYGPNQYMNPVGGRYVTYPPLTPGQDQDYGIVVQSAVSAAPQASPATAAEVTAWYWQYLGRPPSVGDLAYWTAQPDASAVQTAIALSPEAVARRSGTSGQAPQPSSSTTFNWPLILGVSGAGALAWWEYQRSPGIRGAVQRASSTLAPASPRVRPLLRR